MIKSIVKVRPSSWKVKPNQCKMPSMAWQIETQRSLPEFPMNRFGLLFAGWLLLLSSRGRAIQSER
jgi:hypothetical protein